MSVVLTFPSLECEDARRRAVQDVYRWLRAGETLDIRVGPASLDAFRIALEAAGLPPLLLVPWEEDAARVAPDRKLKVVLLGHGTVGGGVLEALAAYPEHFEVVRVGVRDPARHSEVDPALLGTDAVALVEEDADVVVELIGGLDPARAVIATALALGRHVVTANKAVIARCPGLVDVAGDRLRYSAAVGGVIPVIENARRLKGQVTRIEGVLNGTCNFILGRLARGEDFDDAVRAAQAAGFAEADPSTDLHGWDAAHKAVVLAREAFGIHLEVGDVKRAELRGSPGPGTWRQIVEITPEGAAVTLRRVEEGPFARLEDADNCVVFEGAFGREVLFGKGAGRWPTTTSVLGDLLDLHAELGLVHEKGARHAT